VVTQRRQAWLRSCVEAAKEEESGCSMGGCSFYSQWRRLAKAAQATAGAVPAVKLGAVERRRSERDQHGQHRCSDRAADGWTPAVLDFFPIYPKPAQL
jgi:hypothetical protein